MNTQQFTKQQIQQNTKLLLQASTIGDLDEVKRLIPLSNPKDSAALLWAAENGHAECVKLLIPVSDPKSIDSWALQLAAQNGHTEIVELLIPVSDCNLVLQCMISDNSNIDTLKQCIEKYETLQQKERLTNHLNDPSDSQKMSVKRKI